MDEWFAELGNFFSALPQAPGLAVDMALYGPPADQAGYALVKSLLGTSQEIELDAPQEMDFERLG